MKKILILLIALAAISTNYVNADGWPVETLKRAAKVQLRMDCLNILSKYPAGSSGGKNAVYTYLVTLGTPESFEMLKELVAVGTLPVTYLPK